MNALIEQKLELTEKELKDYKAKYQTKDTDFKEVNKELNRTRKELHTLTNQLHIAETEHQDAMHSLKQEHEMKMKELKERVEESKGTSSEAGSPADKRIQNQLD